MSETAERVGLVPGGTAGPAARRSSTVGAPCPPGGASQNVPFQTDPSGRVVPGLSLKHI
ncbi:hypothetical protein CZ771_10665 [Actinomycetales bacterium JB111]|nr:hypothetical protein CZ771_10665 [Actinomycetales bacterium JB111]